MTDKMKTLHFGKFSAIPYIEHFGGRAIYSFSLYSPENDFLGNYHGYFRMDQLKKDAQNMARNYMLVKEIKDREAAQ
jgi:hypothetical protein